MIKDTLQNYIQSISLKYSYDETSEMGYRTDFEILLKGIFESIKVSRFDHDARAKQGNKPDFVVVKNDIPILYIETKDIGISLDKIEKSEQMARYFGYANLVLTDYVEFRFYRNGLPYGEPIKIAEYNKNSRTIAPFPSNFEYLAKTLVDFTQSHKEPIRSGKHLAKIMGGKAQRIRDNIKEILVSESGKGSELINVYETIKRLIVQDLTIDSFADMYAQTLVYGLFVARFYDDSLDTFNRQEARDLIPASNPFLGHFFDHIAGRNFEKRLSYIVDELCDVFTHADVAKLMEQHFKVSSKKGTERGQDQVIHFYEDFLKEYDDELRKKMGAYYTPLPVVQFIVRSVDQLLEKEFGLAGGLANTSKTKDGLHKVQVLDPAVGTGTFISDVIGKIYKRIKNAGQKGRWPSYVHHDLLPRIFGFELMMAPYTIAHLKLSMALKETGFLYFNETRTGKARLGIYLTNSLEEVNKQPELLAFDFGASIAEEAKQASKIKNEKPIMVVVGNPPYSVSSSNKGEWIQNQIKVYKQGLNERKINLDDDYIKFIRFAEHFIEKNGSGIVVMITNNSFIDGITHRQMRKHLLETFDDIYILDLHGNSKKKETAPDGGKDENVFDIQQGVSINIFIRKNTVKEELGTVYHTELYGKRELKFDELNTNNMKSFRWQKLNYSKPYYFFIPRDNKSEAQYSLGFKIDELMIDYNSGIQTKNDSLSIKFDEKELCNVLDDFLLKPINELKAKYSLKDTSGWTVKKAKKSLEKDYEKATILYRPFDFRKSILQKQSGGFIGRSRYKTAKHLLQENLGLVTVRQQSTFDFQHVLATRFMIESGAISLQTKEWGYVFPLYLYGEDGKKTSNLNPDIVSEIEEAVDKTTPEDIFDYIYAVLHSPSYREKYKEFLKIDFPRIPYPSDKKTFQKLVSLGKELRLLHLLESPKVNTFITTYPESGSDTVERLEFKDGNVYINETQYFGNVPKLAWEFWIGGYQPAQKWLKDRKGRILTNQDIEHYQKIIVTLYETDVVMKKIDGID
ncbi:DNA methyltransferase [Candidatus Falkowbacteria bacterium CG11_big_fil_rev_8_21_14_0_20_39_10]|uniref:site-specific DNA-methyltransferase (adenine-specific) n=1 Tax=Candidatus Falkowbacteria bacterium CG11_big_fil_rev_8_21_14_0_20_39_10 TaxID=1974570 RepID=A0A2M6K8P8_9BACT|nr:MAG: DNA methyltransferase [Candidatus Falkowbacteria bacterium CG11_big_fil_rev_8_21_14_0_20_39_10]